MSQQANKKAAAEAAIEYVKTGMTIGVGTGSTANFFIDALADVKDRIEGAVASSEETTRRLREHEVPVLDLDHAGDLPLYIDGADEATRSLALIKGGGGALTREKIIAAASGQFVCIADQSKLVDSLGEFPLPVEVIPFARAYVARQLSGLGGRAVPREGFTTDNGNLILDVHGLDIADPVALESAIDHIAGVVSNGLFARRAADVLLLGTDSGVDVFESEG